MQGTTAGADSASVGAFCSFWFLGVVPAIDGEFATSQGYLAHEIAEQTDKQAVLGLKGKNTQEGFEGAHTGSAINRENAVNGSTRRATWGGSTSKRTVRNGQQYLNGRHGFVYGKNGKTGVSVMDVKDNNITNVQQVYADKKK